MSAGLLSIGALAERTGVSTATLRTWEARHGFPVPERLSGGHRRYPASMVAEVAAVLEYRAQGLQMDAAVARARAGLPAGHESVLAGLRATRPDVRTQVLTKRTLLALTHALEDESCARARRPLLFAAFQDAKFYRRSRARYQDLATTAEKTVVFADFPKHGRTDRKVVEVAVPRDAPLRREWVLICHSSEHQACVAGWELPGQAATPDAERRYETTWSIDPATVAEAARVCTGLMRAYAGAAGASSRAVAALADRLDERLRLDVPRAQDPRDAVALFDRLLRYVDED